MAKETTMDKLLNVQSEGSEDFDFMGDGVKEAGSGALPDGVTIETATGGNPESPDETATGGNPEQEEEATSPILVGGLTRKVTLEARKRANSPRGLDIEAFVNEFKLVGNINVEHLLTGPLPTD